MLQTVHFRCVIKRVRVIDVFKDEPLQFPRVRREHQLLIVRIAGLVWHQDVPQRLRIFLEQGGEPLEIQQGELEFGFAWRNLDQVMQRQVFLVVIRGAEVEKPVLLEAEAMRFITVRFTVFNGCQPVGLPVETFESPVLVREVCRASFRPDTDQPGIETLIFGGVEWINRDDDAAGQQGHQRESCHNSDRCFHDFLFGCRCGHFRPFIKHKARNQVGSDHGI